MSEQFATETVAGAAKSTDREKWTKSGIVVLVSYRGDRSQVQSSLS